MIDHFTVTVADYEKSRDFYRKVLAPLGYAVKMEFEGLVGFGDDRKPYLWFKKGDSVTTPQHIAFLAPSRAAVDAFHQAALELGARDDGAPGLREQYHPHYYGAFVIDPLNGHPIEAVTHHPPGAPKKAKPKSAKARTAKSAKSARKPAPKAKAKAKGKARRGRR